MPLGITTTQQLSITPEKHSSLAVDEMLQHLLLGAENRHTGETRLNRESSRSHSVFMCTVEKTITSNGISKCFYAKLNLVDLAGERLARHHTVETIRCYILLVVHVMCDPASLCTWRL